jgi:geranylgeranyl pyrophosphate synthase
LSLDAVYQPIRADLPKIEAGLGAVGRVSSPWLSELLAHGLAGGGKRIRPALVLLSAKFHHYNLSYLLPMAVAIEVLHTATLVHDDAIDHSSVRRGHPTVYHLWGEGKAILLGDYLLAKAEELVSETQNLGVIRLFARTIMTIASGEITQAATAFNLDQSREQYLERIAAKTASLISLATRSGAVLSEAPERLVEALGEYGYNLGIAFQIVDDILDFSGDEAKMGKPTGSDLAEGTLTLPAMLLLERYPADDNPVRRIFRKEGDRPENIKRAIDLVRQSSVIEECYQAAAEYARRAYRNLEHLPDNDSRQALRELVEFVVARQK